MSLLLWIQQILPTFPDCWRWLHCMTSVMLCHCLHGLSYGPLCMSQQIPNGKTLRSLMRTGPCLTLRAIFSLMAELGPEFFRGKHWVRVMSSSANRMLKGTVKFPRVHLCLSSFTCALRQRRRFQTSQRPPTPGGPCYSMKPTSWNQWRLVTHYLHLELLPPGVVDKEWKTVFPQRLLGLEPDLYRKTGSRLLVFNQQELESSRGKLIRQCWTWKQYHIVINILSAWYYLIGRIFNIPP